MARPFLDVEPGNVPFAHLVSSQKFNALALGKAVTSEHAHPQVSAQNRAVNLGHQASSAPVIWMASSSSCSLFTARPSILCFRVSPSSNVGMVESRGGARFALKTLDGLGIARKIFRKELEGDKAAEGGVLGLIDHAHATAAKFFGDVVVRNCPANHPEGPRESAMLGASGIQVKPNGGWYARRGKCYTLLRRGEGKVRTRTRNGAVRGVALRAVGGARRSAARAREGTGLANSELHAWMGRAGSRLWTRPS